MNWIEEPLEVGGRTRSPTSNQVHPHATDATLSFKGFLGFGGEDRVVEVPAVPKSRAAAVVQGVAI